MHRALRPLLSKPLPVPVTPIPRQFRCSSCPQVFHTKHSLEVHRSRDHLQPDANLRCSLCSTQFFTKHTFGLHTKLHDDNICTFCNTGFRSDMQLNEHIEKTHTDDQGQSRRFVCVKCQRRFCNRKMLLRHHRNVHKATQLQFRCGQCCVEEFYSRVALMEHIQHCSSAQDQGQKEVLLDIKITDIVNNYDDNMPAEFLNYNLLTDDDYFDGDDLLLGNDARHPSMVEEFLDDAFQIPAYDESILEYLMEDMEGSGGTSRSLAETNAPPRIRYKCPRCNSITFTSQLKLNVHLAHDHGEFVLICNECGAKFNQIRDLNAHRNEHKIESRLANKSLNTFFSETCKQPDALSRTIDNGPSLSDKIPPTDTLRCSLCDKTFTTVAGLKYHLKTHTAIKSFRCPFCDRKFVANVNLHAHIRSVHAAHKPHACRECDQRFANAYDLRRHISSTHRHERNFSCPVCEKRFTQQSHLTQHSWQHTGVKPFPCERCPAAYTSQTALKKHTSRVHADVEDPAVSKQ